MTIRGRKRHRPTATEVINANAATTYKAYDARGRVLEVARSIRGAPRSTTLPSTPTISPADSSSMLYPDNYQVAYGYHPGTGLLKSVTGITDFTEYAEFDSYDAAGRAQYVYHGNGTATTLRLRCRLGAAHVDCHRGPEIWLRLQKKSYRYSAAGDIVGITDASAKGSVSRSYQYDRRHRLVAETSVGAEESLQGGGDHPGLRRPVPAARTEDRRGGRGRAAASAMMPTATWCACRTSRSPNRVRERYIAYNADNLPVRIAYAGESGAGGGAAAQPAAGRAAGSASSDRPMRSPHCPGDRRALLRRRRAGG